MEDHFHGHILADDASFKRLVACLKTHTQGDMVLAEGMESKAQHIPIVWHDLEWAWRELLAQLGTNNVASLCTYYRAVTSCMPMDNGELQSETEPNIKPKLKRGNRIAQTKLNSLQAKYGKLQAEIGDLKNENGDLRVKYNEIQIDNDALKNKNEKLSKAHADVELQVKRANANLAVIAADVFSLTEKNNTLVEENERLKAARANTGLQVEKAYEEVEVHREDVELLLDEGKTPSAENAQLKEYKASSSMEINQLRQEKGTAEKELADAKINITNLEKELKIRTSALIAAQDTIISHKPDLGLSNSSVNSLVVGDRRKSSVEHANKPKGKLRSIAEDLSALINELEVEDDADSTTTATATSCNGAYTPSASVIFTNDWLTASDAHISRHALGQDTSAGSIALEARVAALEKQKFDLQEKVHSNDKVTVDAIKSLLRM